MDLIRKIWDWLNEGDYLGSDGKGTRSFELQGFIGNRREKAEKELEIIMWTIADGELEIERRRRVIVLRKFLRKK